jgi:hypothetical protein
MPNRARIGLVAVTVVLLLATARPAWAVPGLGVSTPSVALATFAPGSTATGGGSLTVTTVPPGAWTLKAADTTGHAGHLVPGAVGCAGNEAQTVSPLVVSASGLLGSTVSAGAVTIGSSALTVATGSASDTVSVAYSLVVERTEAMSTGCVFSTTVTYTVQ